MNIPIPRPLASMLRPFAQTTRETRDTRETRETKRTSEANETPATVKAVRKRRPVYAELQVFEQDQVWTGLYPLNELVKRLPAGCGYFYDQLVYRLQGMAVGASAGLIALGGIGWFLAATPGAVMFGLLGGSIGVAAGWIFGVELCPRPQFLVRRIPRTEDGESGYSVEPIQHSYLMDAVDPTALTGNIKPGVFLGTSWDNIIMGRAARRFFTSTMTRGQMLQAAAPVVVAVCSLIVVFLLVVAIQ